MEEEKFTPEQSLLVIRSMIDKTKQDISDKSIHFLIWGWVTFIACTGQFILKHVVNYPGHYHVWWLILVGLVLSAYYGQKEGRRKKVSTYVEDSIRYLWIGMGIAYFVLSMILSKMGWDTSVFPFFILLYGLGTFVSGSIIRFRPLAVGGLCAFALAVGSAFVEYDFQILFAAGAILVSYLIPAYLLRYKSRHSK